MSKSETAISVGIFVAFLTDNFPFRIRVEHRVLCVRLVGRARLSGDGKFATAALGDSLPTCIHCPHRRKNENSTGASPASGSSQTRRVLYTRCSRVSRAMFYRTTSVSRKQGNDRYSIYASAQQFLPHIARAARRRTLAAVFTAVGTAQQRVALL